MPFQMKIALNPFSLKVMEYLMTFQNSDKIYISLNYASRFLKIDKSILEKALQALIDHSILELEKEGLSWVCTFNEETFDEFKSIPFQDLTELSEIKLSEEVKFTKDVIKELFGSIQKMD